MCTARSRETRVCTAQSRECVYVLHSLESACVYCTVWRVRVSTTQSNFIIV